MSEQKRHQARPRRGSSLAANNAAAAAVSTQALLDALDQLAKANGGLGNWFNELEQRSIKRAKSIEMSGIEMGKEADAMQYGVDLITAVFGAAKARLAKLYPSRGTD